MPDKTTAHGRLTEFVRGATIVTPVSVLVTLGVTAVLLVACALLITPRVVAQSGGYLAVNVRDEYPFLTSKILDIAQHSPHGISVLVIGDSAPREAITSEEDLADRVAQRLGTPVRAYLLTSGGLDHWDAVAVTDCVRDHVRGTVLIEISAYDLASPTTVLDSPRASRLGFNSPRLREEVVLAGLTPRHEIGNYFLDNYRFFAARPGVVKNLILGPIQAHQHMVDNEATWSETQWDRKVRRVVGWEKTYAASAPANFDVYRRMVRHLKERAGITVALYEPVLSPRVDTQWKTTRAYRRLCERYHGELAQFAHEERVPLLDLAGAAKLRREDYGDYIHVRTAEGRRRFTEAMAAGAAAALIEAHIESPRKS
ncbi:MAG: hypothetical protein JWN40_3025 [Phycisphaerales bacterium]|nr:hypothetical protein [Phycisphaerales bacterium]